MLMRSQSQTDATLAGLVTSLLPLLSFLANEAILSTRFSLFCYGESQVYVPNPSQHFMCECLNDRYERNSLLAVQKALTRPFHKMKRAIGPCTEMEMKGKGKY